MAFTTHPVKSLNVGVQVPLDKTGILITGLNGMELSTAVPVTVCTPPPLGGTKSNIDCTDTATSVALKSSDNGIPALIIEFGDSVETRVPIGDVDMVYFFVKVIN